MKEGDELFDVNIITIDDKDVSIKDVRQISLSSARLILVDKNGTQSMFNPGTIDCMNMFNTTYYQNAIMKGCDD